MKAKTARLLCIMRCPNHEDFWGVSIDDENGSGTRLTRSKCCGTWRTVKSFAFTAAQWREIAEQAENAAVEIEESERA